MRINGCGRSEIFQPVPLLTSRSGGHAWGVVQRSQAELDLVLTDIIMPGSIDGPVLAARIERRYKKLPVLFMTGALPENDEQPVEMTRKRRLCESRFLRSSWSSSSIRILGKAKPGLKELLRHQLKTKGGIEPVRSAPNRATGSNVGDGDLPATAGQK